MTKFIEASKPVLDGDDWQPCVKLPVTVYVRKQRKGETHVSTREGITPIRPDDLIMRGVSGEEYPIGKEIFEKTYEIGEAKDKSLPCVSVDDLIAEFENDPEVKNALEQSRKRLEAFFAKAEMKRTAIAPDVSSEPVGYTSQVYINAVKNGMGDLGNFAGTFFKNKWESANIPLYTTPQDQTALIRELVEALEVCKPEYSNHSFAVNELLTRAKEAIK